MTLIPAFKRTFFSADSSMSLLIPRKIVPKLKLLESSEITLRNPCGCIWDVSVEFSGTNHEQASLAGAWRYYVQFNNIKDDFDIVFKHIKDSLFDVTIFSRRDVATNQYCGGKFGSISDYKPSFDTKISNTSLQLGRIAIPKSFWDEVIFSSLKRWNTNATLIGPDGDHWVVDIVGGSIGRHYFSGCDEMIEDLKLPLHGFAVFELQPVPYLVFKVWQK